MLEPDRAVLKMIDTIENGKTPYKLITTEKGLALDSKFQIEDSNNFKLNFTLQPDEQKKGIDLNYFFQRPFALVTDGMVIHIKNVDVLKGSRGLQEDTPCNFDIEIKSFRGDVDDSIWKQSRQKAYIKYSKAKFNPYSSGLIFDLKTHKEDNGFFNAVALKVGKVDFLFYHEAIDADNGYFIINPNGQIDFDQFETIVDAVITAYGFLNGFYMRSTIYYFTVKKVENKDRISFYYENFDSAMLSDKPIMDSGNYADVSREQRQLTSIQFNKLVNLLYHDKEYLFGLSTD